MPKVKKVTKKSMSVVIPAKKTLAKPMKASKMKKAVKC